ncbi:MAG: hypothetical protein ACFFB5_13090 [Promethearchaeota archaeon]
MSPVCKKCHNYVMKFPCPHCGSDESFYDRSAEEFKPIIPTELQGDFDEPPPPTNGFGFSSPPVTKTAETHISSRSGSSIQEQTQSPNTMDYKFGSSTTSSSRLENMEITIKTIENEIKTLASDMKNIQKSQKVIENILTNMNKKLIKLEKE